MKKPTAELLSEKFGTMSDASFGEQDSWDVLFNKSGSFMVAIVRVAEEAGREIGEIDYWRAEMGDEYWHDEDYRAAKDVLEDLGRLDVKQLSTYVTLLS